MNPREVLFVCIHNSARSQTAEAFLNALGSGRFEAESAGLEPGKLNPVVVEAMREAGIDLAGRATKSVESMIERGPFFDHVVTVCDGASAERCPHFPGPGRRLHRPFPDPSAFTGTPGEKLGGRAAGARRHPRDRRGSVRGESTGIHGIRRDGGSGVALTFRIVKPPGLLIDVLLRTAHQRRPLASPLPA